VSFSHNPVSKHQGLVLYDGLEHFEIIDNIILNKKNKQITNKFTHVEREYNDGTKDKIILPKGHNSLVYALNKREEISIILDCRKVDDMRQFGRHYHIYEENGNIIVEFVKKTDSREDNSNDEEEFRIFLVLHPDTRTNEYKKVENWFEENYSYDEQRVFSPQSRYVYHALDIQCQRLICSFGTTKTSALQELDKILNNFDRAVKQEERHHILSKHFKKTWAGETGFARLAAVNSMLTLKNDATYNGIYAGMYWFRQFWSRDELISLNSFIKLGDYPFVKQVLFRWLALSLGPL
ncbi:hypothetical protein ACFL96_18950, partial [Thermoproteota archaeon]